MISLFIQRGGMLDTAFNKTSQQMLGWFEAVYDIYFAKIRSDASLNGSVRIIFIPVV